MNGVMWRVVSRGTSLIFHSKKRSALSVPVRAFSAPTGLYGFPHLKTAKGFQSFVDEAIQRYISHRIIFLTQLMLLLLFKLILMQACVCFNVCIVLSLICIFSYYARKCVKLFVIHCTGQLSHMYLINEHLFHYLTYKM